MIQLSTVVANKFGRIFLAMFFCISATLKSIGLFDSTPPPDIAGVDLNPAVIVLIIFSEASIGILLLSRHWVGASITSLFLFIGFAGLATADLLGWVATTERCGCFGSVDVGAQSRLVMSIGGLVLAGAIFFGRRAASAALQPLR